MRRSPLGFQRSDASGATSVFVALTLAVIAGFLALAINVGHLYSVRGELQNGADSGALAGAIDLNQNVSGLATAIDRAGQYAGYHRTDGTVPVDASTIELGHWPVAGEANVCATGEVATGTARPPDLTKFCCVTGRDATAASRINAVRVVTARSAEVPGGAATVFMNGILGAASTANVSTEAVAVGGGICSGCPIPVALSKCYMIIDGTLQCGLSIILRSDKDDNGGLTGLTPDPGGSNTPAYIAVLNDLTDSNPACSNVGIGDTISVKNGANINNNVKDAFRPLIGKTVLAPILDTECPPKFTHAYTIVGFASFTLDAVYANDEAAPGCGTKNGKGPCVKMSLQCNVSNPAPNPSGCAYYGTTHVRLVR